MPSPIEDALLRSFVKPPGVNYARNLATQYGDEPTAKLLREMERRDMVGLQSRILAKWKIDHPEDENTPSLVGALGRLMTRFGKAVNGSQ